MNFKNKKMRDIKSFCKIFDLSVPSFEDFDYYRQQLSRIERWKNLDELVALHEKAEDEIGDMFEYRVRKIDEVIEFVKNTRAYNDMADDNLIPDYPTSKSFEYSEGIRYLSVDMKMANWQVMKKYDPSFVNELGDTYSEFLSKFGIPEVFHRSKHIRQYIFGNLSPKRQIKAQRAIVEDRIVQALSKHGLKIECIKSDEVIYSFDDIETARKMVEELDSERFSVKAFSIEKVEGFRINNYICLESGETTHREMVGCNGQKFFMLLKKHIFHEPYDIRDLYFRMDGELAVWKKEGMKIEL